MKALATIPLTYFRSSSTPRSTAYSYTTQTDGRSTTVVVVPASSTTGGQLNGADNSSDGGFFDNSGAVGGTFAAVGIVAALLLGFIGWLLYKRRRAQRMDADVAMAASAAAATTRTPFDDDDPEMIETPGMYAAAGSGSASNFYHPSQGEYEGSHFSGGNNGQYNSMNTFATPTGYQDYYNGANSQGHYYDNPHGEYLSGHSHDPNFSQGHYYDEAAAAAGYAYPQDGWGHQAQHMDPEGMPFTGGAQGAEVEADRRRSAGMPNPHNGNTDNELLGPNVFADQPESSPEPADAPAYESDTRLDNAGLQRNNTRGSTGSLRDDQDYTRRVLALAN